MGGARCLWRTGWTGEGGREGGREGVRGKICGAQAKGQNELQIRRTCVLDGKSDNEEEAWDVVVLGRALEGKGRRKAGAMGSTRASRRRDRQVVVEASGGDVCWSLLLCGAAGAWHGMVMAVWCACEEVIE